MINFYEVNETQQMIEHENLDVEQSHLESVFWTVLILIWIS